MQLQIKIFTKPGCPKCHLTKHLFDRSRLDYQEILINPDTDTKAMNQLKAHGYKSFPVVQVFQDHQMINDWCDFRPDNIKQLIAQVKGDTHAA